MNYEDNYNNESHEVEYFGWLSCFLPHYEDTTKIPVNVVKKPGNLRPEIIPHHTFEHEFVNDYYKGITKEEAEKRIHEMLKNVQ